MGIVKQSGPTFRVTTANHGDIEELGVGSIGDMATLVVDFEPSLDWIGQFIVMGKPFGVAAEAKSASFKPVPYHLVNRSNVAAQYEIISDPVSDSGLIQIPASGLSIALLVACTQGYMDVVVWRLSGSATG